MNARRFSYVVAVLVIVVTSLSGCDDEATRSVATTPTVRGGECVPTAGVPTNQIPDYVADELLRSYGTPQPRGVLSAYGNDALWVSLPSGAALREQNTFPTVRLVPGTLTVEAYRPGSAAARPPRIEVMAGYGDIGLQQVRIDFFTPGCWQIVERVAGHELRWIAEVGHAIP